MNLRKFLAHYFIIATYDGTISSSLISNPNLNHSLISNFKRKRYEVNLISVAFPDSFYNILKDYFDKFYLDPAYT